MLRAEKELYTEISDIEFSPDRSVGVYNKGDMFLVLSLSLVRARASSQRVHEQTTSFLRLPLLFLFLRVLILAFRILPSSWATCLR